MASIINAATSGGLITTADTSGILQLQTAGTTAVTVDASQRAAFVAGTAAAPAITTTGDTNTGIFFPAADTIAFAEGGAEAMRIDASGNMGLKVTPSPWATYSVLQQANGSLASVGTQTQVIQNAYFDGSNMRYITSNGASRYGQDVFGGATHYWYNAPSGTAGNVITFTQAMTLDASGKLLVGLTSGSSSPAILQLERTNTTTASTVANIVNTAATSTTRTTNAIIRVASNGNGADGSLQFTDAVANNSWFGQNNAGAYVVCNSGGVRLASTGTSWASDSDERVKDIIEPITDAANKVSTLRAVIGKYKTDAEGTRRSFLIAQDVQSVLPEAVVAQPDEIGTLSLSYTDVIPLLVAAIKEQQVLITQLQADVAALKGA